ncbi:MAG: hypothetical protein KQA41_04285 [Candidatus Aenigmarchaeota archaeon]|nr:hypothetical protein [Candidatus Aenigmarchaeota archaeon]
MNLNKISVVFLIFLLLLRTNESSDFVAIMNSSISSTSFYYIQTSNKLSDGIFFTNSSGVLEKKQYPLQPGSSNNNALWNYNTTFNTEYWIYAFVYNTEISICHGAVHHLCSNPNCVGPDNYIIDISNVKWSKSFSNDVNNPSLQEARPFSIGFDNQNKIIEGLNSEATLYFRYWLDVPPGSSASVYNTTYQIMAVVGGYDC